MIGNNNNQGNKQDKAKANIIRELAPYYNLGLQLVVTIAVTAYGGWLLDDYLATQPVFLIILTFFGAIAGMVNFIMTVMKKNKK